MEFVCFFYNSRADLHRRSNKFPLNFSFIFELIEAHRKWSAIMDWRKCKRRWWILNANDKWTWKIFLFEKSGRCLRRKFKIYWNGIFVRWSHSHVFDLGLVNARGFSDWTIKAEISLHFFHLSAFCVFGFTTKMYIFYPCESSFIVTEPGCTVKIWLHKKSIF